MTSENQDMDEILTSIRQALENEIQTSNHNFVYELTPDMVVDEVFDVEFHKKKNLWLKKRTENE